MTPIELTVAQAARLLDVSAVGLRRLLIDTKAPQNLGRTPFHTMWRIEVHRLICHLLLNRQTNLARRLAEQLYPTSPPPEPNLDGDIASTAAPRLGRDTHAYTPLRRGFCFCQIGHTNGEVTCYPPL